MRSKTVAKIYDHPSTSKWCREMIEMLERHDIVDVYNTLEALTEAWLKDVNLLFENEDVPCP